MKAVRVGTRIGGSRARNILLDALAQDEASDQLVETVRTARGNIAFACPSALTLWRARTLTTKEPETLEWIDSFSHGDTLWDVGANVGIYSLYAGISGTCRVLAFEPAAGNYYLLNRNIEINGLGDKVQAFCIAFNDRSVLDALNMQSTELGAALSGFSEAIDNFGARFIPKFRQGMVGYSIDEFIERFDPPFPNHLKIDVDGIEDKIVKGAVNTLRDGRLKSVSIELDSGRDDFVLSVTSVLQEAGLQLSAKRHAEMFESGTYKDIFNYQFRRVSAGEEQRSTQ